LVPSLPQKEFGILTSTPNWHWNLEHAKKITRGKYSSTKTMHPMHAKMQARAKSEKLKLE
jgi:hypothetical protein